MKKILFRADAKPSIGAGDLISLISLSKYFVRAGWKTHFMIRGYEAGLKISQKYNMPNLTVLDPDISIDNEVKAINTFCAREKIDIVFFEITERKLSDYAGLSAWYKKAAISFDGDLLDDLSLAVSWVPDACELFHPERQPHTKFLLGYEYVTLPPEFHEDPRIRNRQYKPRPERLLIAMGGADENNLTKKVVDALTGNDIKLEITVVIGGGYEHHDDLEKRLKTSGLSFEVRYNITDMLNEYLTCDVAIGAGGLTASELVASRTPALLIAAYEHQIGRCRAFDAHGWARFLGFRSFDEKKLLEGITIPLVSSGSTRFNTKAILDAIEKISQH